MSRMVFLKFCDTKPDKLILYNLPPSENNILSLGLGKN